MHSKQDPYFTTFKKTTTAYILPKAFHHSYETDPHPLSILAAGQLQVYLQNQNDWVHNFGLEAGKEGKVIGKMFGVLVVKNQAKELGFLAAFSGKLAGGNSHAKFVPPVYDALAEGGFLSKGMDVLALMGKEIQALQAAGKRTEVENLKKKRRQYSISLQGQLFDNYTFLNQAGVEKNLRAIFHEIGHKNPPSGAGECAAPKLLQYAFQHKMTPLSIAEFWWGLSPKSNHWKHKHFYPMCEDKCAPIMGHMLAQLTF